LQKILYQEYNETNVKQGAMRLDKFLDTQVKKEFAATLGISVQALANYANGLRLTPLSIAIHIEKLTHRKVTVEELYAAYVDAQYEKSFAKISKKKLCKD
jgi:DNA-binding transcriptional regulator YdaS (Cro superfamily)